MTYPQPQQPWGPPPPPPQAPHPYPGVPQQPYPPGGWPGGGVASPAAPKRRGRLALLIGGGLVAMLALCAGTAWGVSSLVGGKDSAGGDGKLKTAWVLDFPKNDSVGLSRYDKDDMFGAWLVGDAVVRAQADGIIAYQLADGAQAWGAPSPDGTSLCVAAQTLADGKGAVALGTTETCGTVAGFDATSGKLTWQVKIPAPVRQGRGVVKAPTLTVAGQQVVVRSEEELIGLRLTDGKQLWRTSAEKLTPGRDCRLRDAQAGGRQVVVTARCLPGGEIDSLDPATGKLRWRQKLPESELSTGVLSVEPLVSLSGLGNDNYALRDARGKVRASFGATVDGTDLNTLSVNRSNSIEGPDVLPYLADADNLYLRTHGERVPGKLRDASAVIAIDLATGKRRWVSSGHTPCQVEMIRLDGSGMLAWEAGDRRNLAPRLVRIDLASGKSTLVAEGPLTAGFEGEGAKILERDGTVVIVPWKHVTAKAAITVLR